jgi:subfamily B ATP-binding cassette protein MsbA
MRGQSLTPGGGSPYKQRNGVFLSLLKPYKARVLFCFACIVITNLIGLSLPWGIKLIIDNVLINRDYRLLNLIAIGLMVIFVFRVYFGFMKEYLSALIGERVVCDLRRRLHWHLQRLSLRLIDKTSSGQIISRIIGDVDSIRNFLFGGALDFLYSLFNLGFVLTVLFVLDWRLTLISLIYLPIFGIAYFKLVPVLQKRHKILRQRYAELTGRLGEVFSGIRIVRVFGRSEYEDERFASKQNEILRIAISTHRLGTLLWTGAEFLSSLGLVTLLWFGARAVLAGRITPGVLLAFYSYLGMLFFPVVKMVIINNDYQEAAASIGRIGEALGAEREEATVENPVALNRIKGNVVFENVSFSYCDDTEVLADINLEVRQGEVVALVGPSGTGKTTIVSLLARFFDPTSGRILIDGYDLRTLDLERYRANIAIVLQDDFLFSDSIRENILYGLPVSRQGNLTASEAEIIKVAKAANAHQFIIQFPEGYDTEVGERGVRLSGGQRQRIAIARAFLRNPAILILDEATSNLDSASENLIQESLRELMRGRTTFVIAHRLSTVINADKIVVIERGRIVQAGKHFDLLRREGPYRRLYEEQYKKNKQIYQEVQV